MSESAYEERDLVRHLMRRMPNWCRDQIFAAYAKAFTIETRPDVALDIALRRAAQEWSCEVVRELRERGWQPPANPKLARMSRVAQAISDRVGLEAGVEQGLLTRHGSHAYRITDAGYAFAEADAP